MNIGNRLKQLRKEKGVTQKQIATYLGIKQNSYSQYENGDRELGLETISKIAKYYKVAVQDFFISPEIKHNYENLFLTELGALFERKVKEVMKVTDYLHFNSAENDPNFVYQRQNQVSEEEKEELHKTYEALMVQLEQLGNEVKKAIDRDLEHFRRKNNSKFTCC